LAGQGCRFQCWASGGLVAGVNYVATAGSAAIPLTRSGAVARQYGDGASERNLGRVLKNLRPSEAIVGTKVRVPPAASGDLSAIIRRSLEGSLQRLGLESLDIFYLHNPITLEGSDDTLSARRVLEEVVPAFTQLRQQGKIRFLGLTAVGQTRALHEAIDARVFDVAQVPYNLSTAQLLVLCRKDIQGRITPVS
jgi:aryl-alcohol dehydrogenase-like predicted oxidoreductase